MAKLSITLASDRYDFLRPLIDGEIQPEGIDLRIIEVIPPSGLAAARHQRMYRFDAYDAAEFALVGHIAAVSRGDLKHRAIPCFPRRMFPHKFVVVRTDRGIDTPSDLKGKRIGIVNWENTLQVPLRRALQEQYGLSKDAVRWVVANRGVIGVSGIPGVQLEFLETERTLEELLLDGDLDGVALPYIINAIIAGDPHVRPLFSSPRIEEANYFKLTGHFPLMHNIILKQSILEREPWVVHSLIDAFKLARTRHLEWMQQPTNMMFAWAREELVEERNLLGATQWQEGFRATRAQLNSICELAYEQGVIEKPVQPEELFFPSTLDS